MVKDNSSAPAAAETKAEDGKANAGKVHEKKKQPRAADDVMQGMGNNKTQKKEWTVERLRKIARRFDSEDAWKRGAPSSYKAAHARGLVGQCIGDRHGRRVG